MRLRRCSSNPKRASMSACAAKRAAEDCAGAGGAAGGGNIGSCTGDWSEGIGRRAGSGGKTGAGRGSAGVGLGGDRGGGGEVGGWALGCFCFLAFFAFGGLLGAGAFFGDTLRFGLRLG